MEFKCENMTPFGCERMDAVKELMLFEQIESDIELDLNNICKRQCCKDCDNKCSYECGRVKYLDPVEQFKKEEIKSIEYTQLSFFQGGIRTILSKVNEIVNRAKEIMEAKGTSPLASVIKAIEEMERELEGEQWKK